MTVDFTSELEKKFFADNLLLNEDWENGMDGRFPDDLSQLLDVDVESNMQVDALMNGLPDDLEIPMLDASEGLDLSTATLSDPWKDFSDGSDSGLECNMQLGIKDEPLSPASSHGSDSTDSLSSQFCVETQLPYPLQQITLPPEVKLESPPLTPPRDLEVCFSPVTSITMTSQPSVPLTQTITTLPLQTGVHNGTNVTKLPISRVTNNKVMIQPKPTTLIQPKSPVQTQQAVGKPLVLTPEEFAKLTAQGVLKFNPPAKTPDSNSKTKVLSPTVPTATLPITPGPAPAKTPAIQTLSFKNAMPLPSSDVDVKTIKRQQRMIKNRESACLSRKRKKEYMSGLEQRLHDFSVENEKLKQENTVLRKKVEMLNSENERLKGIAPLGQAKKVTCVLAVMLLLSLNLGSFTGIMLGSQDEVKQISPSDVHHGRTLLSAKEESAKEQQFDFLRQPDFAKAQSTLERLRREMDVLTRPDRVSSSKDLVLFNKAPDSMCPTYFNTTESQRLMNELTGWVLGHKAEQKQAQEQQKQRLHNQKEKERKNKNKKHRRKSPAYRHPEVPANGADLQQYPGDRSGQYGVQLFNGVDRYADLLDAIHRRNDTFYVVSFRRDHLLLPATAHNKTTRPRMSLVMPAVSLNDTMEAGTGHIAMMQIDCEVMATRLVEVSKSAVPQYSADNITAGQTMDPPIVPPGPNRSSRYRKSGNQ